jgi:peptidoglycan hydrolase-like protein with peptidoglycan-binding domain/predicted chitinase
MSDGHGYSTDGFGIDQESSVRLIIKTALDEGVTDPHQIAYMLATAQHETRNFTAPEEDFGRQQAQKLRYHGGEDFFGRGYVHLTHIENYQRFDKLLGLNGQLMEHKELAEKPEIAARILVIGMRDGEFTSRRLDQYVNSKHQDFTNARRVVNGTDKASLIADYAEAWDQRLPALIQDVKAKGVQLQHASAVSDAGSLLAQGSHGNSVRALQGRLAQLGYSTADNPLATDGNFGPNTQHAVEAFQQDRHLTIDGKVGPDTQAALEQAVKTQATRSLQGDLDQLGYKDAQGQSLKVDGEFGTQTRFALEAFQRVHQLTVDGKASPQTRTALDQALGAKSRGDHSTAHAVRLDDPRHPDNALYQQALTGVHKIDADMGRTSDQLSTSLAASLAAQAKAQGLTRIGKVALNEDGSQTFAVENRDGLMRHTNVLTAQAVHTSMQQSTAAAQAITAPPTLPEQRSKIDQVPTQQQANPPAMV